MNNHRFVKPILGTMRFNFVTLTLFVILLAVSLVTYQGFEISSLSLSLVLIAGISAHLAVNMLNEYEDWKSGLDSITVRTPFSGGSGSLQSLPEELQSQAAKLVKNLGFIFVVITALIGLYFISQGLWLLLPLGLIGLVLVVYYTTHITRQPWLCLIAPGLAFGPLMMVGTYIVLTGALSWSIVGLSLLPFLLVNNLLLLNQLPDLEADKQVGRFNIWMQVGHRSALRIFFAFNILVFVFLLMLVGLELLPLFALIALLALVILMVMKKDLNLTSFEAQSPENLMSAMKMNVMINHLVPLLISVGLWVS